MFPHAILTIYFPPHFASRAQQKRLAAGRIMLFCHFINAPHAENNDYHE
jgi:hypothetical protein